MGTTQYGHDAGYPSTGILAIAEPDQPLFSTSDQLRFVPSSPGFRRRTQLVNALLGNWPIVAGTSSWLEAHLVARLALSARMPNLCGSGVNEREVWDLVSQQIEEGDKAGELLVILSDSIATDQGQALIQRLRRRGRVLILLLVQQDDWITAETLAACQAQAIVHVESFGSGRLIRALQALRHGQCYVDPRLDERLQQQAAVGLSCREKQVLAGLARGLTNRAIALEGGIATTTVRDYVSSLSRKLGATNRTQALSRALSLGLVSQPCWSAPVEPGTD